ncbi:MAG TPA: ATP-binding protein [Steroidobacteraceae bacterium]|nr:ATP-binding protein [Steroidobacteraceae bacterium]
MKPPSAERRSRVLTAGVGALLMIVMAGVLAAGFRLATQMRESFAALQTASALQWRPPLIAQQITSLRDRLESRAYTGQTLADLKVAIEAFDRDLEGLASGAGASAQVEQARLLWQQHRPALDPITAFDGQPYVDSEERGSSLSRGGLSLYGDVKRAQRFARENTRDLQALLAGVAAELQDRASKQAGRLRLLLSAGVLAAAILLVAAAWLQLTRRRSERAAREAREQTRDILQTVKEGFFLLDADYRIGAVWSSALARMFGRQDFAGLSFEELLEDRVPPATLATAAKYIKLLWGDRAHENLMKSINPLGQVEIQMDDGRGGRDARFLQFDFHRVMGEQGVKHVLVSVTDVTANVLLARELAESQQNASQQADMMLGVLQLDPVQLISFLDAADAGLSHVNSIMKEPARDDGEFRRKLDKLFRELHAVKGEASALGLMSAAQRVHAIEDMIAELKREPQLAGNHFLPLLLKVDELMSHLRGLRELAARLAALPESKPAPVPHAAPAAARGAPSEISATLNALAGRLSTEHGKSFKLKVTGVADVPAPYQSIVKDILIQILRNAVVHGMETSDVRLAQSKSEMGQVRFDFRRLGDEFELVCEDDGAGLAPERLRSAAVSKGLATKEEAAALDYRGLMSLIFKPGFSTADKLTMDAGRGIGMDLVARSVYGAGGRIGVATSLGKFTRFKITLPAVAAANAAVA